jgi:glycosyltransferase involved in cell wall biosynthesis
METFVGDLLKSPLSERHTILLLDISKPRLQRKNHYAIKTGYAVFQRKLSTILTSYLYSATFLVKYFFWLFSQPIDIIHIHTASFTSFWEKCIYIVIGRLAGKKIVLHIHGALFKEFYVGSSRFAQNLIQRFIKMCGVIIVLSPSWERFFAAFVDVHKIFVVENGIDLKPFARQGEKSDGFAILHMGEVSERKGIYDLIKVIEVLKEKQLDFHFEIVGPGELQNVATIIERNGLTEHIRLRGPRYGEQRYQYFRRAHCFVLASYGEGLPIALIEALAAGLPVVVTSVGGVPDVIAPGRHGFLCQPGKITEIADALTTLIKSVPLRDQMAQDNREYAYNHFDIKKCADRISQIYKMLVLPKNCNLG